MAIYKYSNKIEAVWENADHCSCGSNDCHPNNHRECGICHETIFYGSHESVRNQVNSRGAWNLDHIKPNSLGGSNEIKNLQAVHICCNRWKGNHY